MRLLFGCKISPFITRVQPVDHLVAGLFVFHKNMHGPDLFFFYRKVGRSGLDDLFQKELGKHDLAKILTVKTDI